MSKLEEIIESVTAKLGRNERLSDVGEQQDVHVNAWTWGKHAILDTDKVDWGRLHRLAQAGAKAFAEEKADNEKQWELFFRYENS